MKCRTSLLSNNNCFVVLQVFSTRYLVSFHSLAYLYIWVIRTVQIHQIRLKHSIGLFEYVFGWIFGRFGLGDCPYLQSSQSAKSPNPLETPKT